MFDFVFQNTLVFSIYIIYKRNWNIFKYTFSNICPKPWEKIKEVVKITLYSRRFLNYFKWLDIHKDFKLQNVPILTNCGSIFFSSSDMRKFHHLLGCYAIDVNSSLIIFLSSLCFSNLICWGKNLSWLDWKLKHYAWQKIFFKNCLF